MSPSLSRRRHTHPTSDTSRHLGHLDGSFTTGGRDQRSTQCPAPPPSLEGGGGTHRSRLLTRACSGPAPTQDPTQSHFDKTKDTAVSQEIPRDSGAGVRTQGPTRDIRSDAAAGALATGKSQAFWRRSQGPGAERNMCLVSVLLFHKVLFTYHKIRPFQSPAPWLLV